MENRKIVGHLTKRKILKGALAKKLWKGSLLFEVNKSKMGGVWFFPTTIFHAPPSISVIMDASYKYPST